MPYRIDPDRDRPHIEEFRRNPIGHHSPGLMRVLNAMRYDTGDAKPVLIVRKAFREWILGAMPRDRSKPIVPEPERVFTSREEAEWVVFCRRWETHTGERINMPFRMEGDEGETA
ncbi:MAG: hypothetical protein GY798_22125 [Hyphomicrobiales bacterium]|nr:hypothetical protein [Hyphomicrobiales bacterium]